MRFLVRGRRDGSPCVPYGAGCRARSVTKATELLGGWRLLAILSMHACSCECAIERLVGYPFARSVTPSPRMTCNISTCANRTACCEQHAGFRVHRETTQWHVTAQPHREPTKAGMAGFFFQNEIPFGNRANTACGLCTNRCDHRHHDLDLQCARDRTRAAVERVRALA